MKSKSFEELVKMAQNMKDGSDEKEDLLMEMQDSYPEEFDEWIKEIS